MDLLSDQAVHELLERLISSAQEIEIPVKAQRFFKVGEDALAARELLLLAASNKEFGQKWSVELQSLNEHFSRLPHPRGKMGFPIQLDD